MMKNDTRRHWHILAGALGLSVLAGSAALAASKQNLDGDGRARGLGAPRVSNIGGGGRSIDGGNIRVDGQFSASRGLSIGKNSRGRTFQSLDPNPRGSNEGDMHANHFPGSMDGQNQTEAMRSPGQQLVLPGDSGGRHLSSLSGMHASGLSAAGAKAMLAAARNEAPAAPRNEPPSVGGWIDVGSGSDGGATARAGFTFRFH